MVRTCNGRLQQTLFRTDASSLSELRPVTKKLVKRQEQAPLLKRSEGALRSCEAPSAGTSSTLAHHPKNSLNFEHRQPSK